MSEPPRLTTSEAAAHLGVRTDTLYAYVSRGLLHSHPAPSGRGSTFDAEEIARFAASRRRSSTVPSRPERGIEVADRIASALTLIAEDGHFYRGHNARALAHERTFEETAALLWSGAFGERTAWRASPSAVGAAAAIAAMPAPMPPLQRLHLVVPAAAAADTFRHDIQPGAVMATARGLIAALVDGLPRRRPELAGGMELGGISAPPGLIAARLWTRLSDAAPARGVLAALNGALVLLADHELNASTLAARIAASVHADPYAVVQAGLAVASGSLHGAASLVTEAMLDEIADPEEAARAVGERLRRGDRVPGFGHPLYPAGDPRADDIVRLLRAADVHRKRLARVLAVMEAMAERGLPPPNVDFALGALAHVTGMRRGAGEVLFAVARTAGWIAHALEEYASPNRYRPRAEYVGATGAGS